MQARDDSGPDVPVLMSSKALPISDKQIAVSSIIRCPSLRNGQMPEMDRATSAPAGRESIGFRCQGQAESETEHMDSLHRLRIGLGLDLGNRTESGSTFITSALSSPVLAVRSIPKRLDDLDYLQSEDDARSMRSANSDHSVALSISSRISNSEVHKNAEPLQRIVGSGFLGHQRCQVTGVLGFLALVFLPFIINCAVNPSGGRSDTEMASERWISVMRQDVIPWYQSKQGIDLRSKAGHISQFEVARGPRCVRYWHQQAKRVLIDANKTMTDPAMVGTILARLLGENFWPAMQVLGQDLTEPQDLLLFMDGVSRCMEHNIPLSAMACASMDDTDLRLKVSPTDSTFQREFYEILHFMIVLERLTAGAVLDATFAERMFEQMNDKFESENLFDKGIYGMPESKKFVVDKYLFVKGAYELAIEYRKSAKSQPKVADAVLQLNILEAALFDIDRGFWGNGLSGISLAWHAKGFAPYTKVMNNQQSTYLRPLGSDWVQNYIAWNAVFASHVTSTPLGNSRLGTTLSKLFIPSIVCSSDSIGGADFLYPRVISLFMTLNYLGHDNPLPGTLTEDLRNHNATAAWGNIMLRFTPWSMPSGDDLREMADDMERVFRPRGLSLFSFVRRQDAHLIATLSLVFCCTVAAVAVEVALSMFFWPYVSEQYADGFWYLSDMVYALLMSISIYSQSVFGIPFMMIGLWRMGVPEATSYIATALQNIEETTFSARIVLFIKGTSMIVHHTATAFVVCSVSVGYSTLDIDMMAVILPLSFQHLSAALKWQSVLGHRFVIFCIELWWQFEAFHFMKSVHPLHEKIACATMMASHYGYAFAHALDTSRILMRGENQSKLVGNYGSWTDRECKMDAEIGYGKCAASTTASSLSEQVRQWTSGARSPSLTREGSGSVLHSPPCQRALKSEGVNSNSGTLPNKDSFRKMKQAKKQEQERASS